MAFKARSVPGFAEAAFCVGFGIKFAEAVGLEGVSVVTRFAGCFIFVLIASFNVAGFDANV